jgi:hypothetical protein
MVMHTGLVFSCTTNPGTTVCVGGVTGTTYAYTRAHTHTHTHSLIHSLPFSCLLNLFFNPSSFLHFKTRVSKKKLYIISDLRRVLIPV